MFLQQLTLQLLLFFPLTCIDPPVVSYTSVLVTGYTVLRRPKTKVDKNNSYFISEELNTIKIIQSEQIGNKSEVASVLNYCQDSFVT